MIFFHSIEEAIKYKKILSHLKLYFLDEEKLSVSFVQSIELEGVDKIQDRYENHLKSILK